MDVASCIALHNEILRHGWIHSGHLLSTFEAHFPTWTEYHANTLQPGLGPVGPSFQSEISLPISPSLQEFLNGARTASNVIPVAEQFSFFYWVMGLSEPAGLFDADEVLSRWGDREQERYVLLYGMNVGPSHSLGLVFDQQTNLSILCPTMYEVDIIFNGRMPWQPLETILGSWLQLVQIGRVKAVTKEEKEGMQEGADYFKIDGVWDHDPWVFAAGYSDAMLQETVDAFDDLVGAIEARISLATGDVVGNSNAEELEYGLVDESVLQLLCESIGLERGGFAYDFLRRVRRPQFSMIAPGLELPNAFSFSVQPFWPDEPLEDGHTPPILLFRSKEMIHTNTIGCQASSGEHTPFPASLHKPSKYFAGLYLLPQTPSPAMRMSDPQPDDIKFLLPFGIGANGYARMSDGSRFGETDKDRENDEWIARDTFADLYRAGFHPFESLRKEHRLITVLRNWRERVESGDWGVGEHGVEGGMGVWREADREGKCEGYVLPLLGS